MSSFKNKSIICCHGQKSPKKCTQYTVSEANLDSSKNMLLLKNPQFLPNHYETLPKQGTHEYYILAKFRNDWVKIVNFLIKAYFCLSLHWPYSQCTRSTLSTTKKFSRFFRIFFSNDRVLFEKTNLQLAFRTNTSSFLMYIHIR